MTYVYMLGAIERIGEVADQMFYLRNLYPEEGTQFDLITFPFEMRPKTNKRFFQIATRGMRHRTSTDEELVYVYRRIDVNRATPQLDGLMVRHGMGCGRDKLEAVLPPGQTLVPYGPVGLNSTFIERYRRWSRPPFHFSLSEEEKTEGLMLQSQLGIPQGAPIVTLHVREGGYLPQFNYDHRYSDITNYFPAVEYLIQQGYWVVRIGDTEMRPIDASSEQFIDLPFHSKYSELADPYLISKSRFVLGTSSGPWAVARGFNIPTLLTNGVFEAIRWAEPGALFVPKHYHSIALGRDLSYEEILTSPAVEFPRQELFDRAGIELRENSSDEILRATKEMHQRVEGTYASQDELERLHTRERWIQEKAHMSRRQHLPRLSYPFLVNFWSSEALATSYLETNPHYLGHDWSSALT